MRASSERFVVLRSLVLTEVMMVGLAAYFVRAGLILGWLFTGLALVQLLVIVRVTRIPG